jgi:hypothetical protein
MALSLQRWAQPPTGTAVTSKLLGQAQLRTCFAARIESHSLASLVDTLHGLVHIAFALFLVGLLLYLYDINTAVYHLAAVGIVFFLTVYAILTALAIIQTGYPYSTPLSKFLVVLNGAFRVMLATFRDRHSSSMSKNAVARRLDDEVLGRTFNLLRSDDELEQFFEALPGYLDSRIADTRRSIELLGQKRLEEALFWFWDRTLTSIRVSESVKGQRLIICMRIIVSEEAGLSITIPDILRRSVDLSGVSGLVEIPHFLGTLRSGRTALLAGVIIASIILINDEHDKRWDTLVMDELEMSEDLFRRYLEHGNSLLLANLIHITRKFFHSLLRRDSDLTRRSLTILSSLSKFDIIGTLPELQQDFCALWDKVDNQSRKRWPDNERFRVILSQTRGLYDALVALPDTHAALRASTAGEDGFLRQRASYSLSKMPDHRIQEGGGSITGGGNHSTTATSPTFPPHPATSTVQSITDTSLTSSPTMVESITRSPSITGDAPRLNEEIIVSSMVFDSAAIRPDYIRQGQESPSSASIPAPSQLNMEEATISCPSTIRRRTSSTISSASSNTHYPGPIRRTTSSAIIIEDDYAQDLGPTAHRQTRLTHHPGETDPSGADANSLGRHDHDSSENSSKRA